MRTEQGPIAPRPADEQKGLEAVRVRRRPDVAHAESQLAGAGPHGLDEVGEERVGIDPETQPSVHRSGRHPAVSGSSSWTRTPEKSLLSATR